MMVPLRVATGWPEPVGLEQELARSGLLQGLLEHGGVVGLGMPSASAFGAHSADGKEQRRDEGEKGHSGQYVKRHSSPPTLGFTVTCQPNHYATTRCR